MSEDQFTKLFKYMQKEFAHVRKQFEVQDRKIDKLSGDVAELSGEVRDLRQELVLLNRKVDRHERWIYEIADEVGVKLFFENK